MSAKVTDTPERRSGDQLVYSQVDFERERERIISENRVAVLSGAVEAMRDTMARVPQDMEVIARRVFAEQWIEIRKENTTTRWRTADTVIALGQMMIAAAVVILAIFR